MIHADLAATAAYTTPPLWRILTKTGYFVGLSGAIGTTVTYAASVRPALRAPQTEADDAAALRRRTSVYLAWAGVVLLVTGYFQLAGRVARAGKGMAFADALAPGRIADFLTAPAAKGAWVAQGWIYVAQNVVLLLAAAALVSLFTAAGRRRLDAVALTALPLSLAITLVGAVPATTPKNAEKVLDLISGQAHIISGTVWIGGLALLAALTAARRRLSGDAGLLWADIWRRFGLVALVSVAGVLISGLWMSWKHVGSPEQLWTTTYGLFLLVKILLVLAMIAAGAVNQLWLMPRIVRARETDAKAPLLHLTLHHFPKVVWAEVVLGIAVLGVVPFLAGSARSEAGSPAPVATGSIFAVGALLVLTLAASLYVTAKASDALARRGLAAAS
ncbi:MULTISPECIES: CopD family protein [unclassified Streptomyces]|uniref:copper resistance D family protein n=1 Tax=unclassified Streptomyces TaxID=2593676 RepID=UPI002E0D76A0|nr:MULTISPECIES: CopD family protein [unclassified Streptomyces]WSR23096.1 CopD family protein [Streptomyces sp. NBC_01205]